MSTNQQSRAKRSGKLRKKGYGDGKVAWYSHNSENRLLSLGMTNSTYRHSAFGTLLGQTGPDAPRFKFSSKEREGSCGFRIWVLVGCAAGTL